jgi:SAM-dependent methyltransferase
MKKFLSIATCPKCKNGLVNNENGLFCSNLNCSNHKFEFLMVNGKPALVDFENSVIEYNVLKNTSAASLVKRSVSFPTIRRVIRKLLNGSGRKTIDNLSRIDTVIAKKNKPRILIVGGGSIGAGTEEFMQKYESAIISFDVYFSENVDFIADGHSIPLQDESVDLVIIQAVLEHVFNPTEVVNECYRVLSSNGIIYAETPFLQHVHEGAYDFTRYTVLGHRILFKKFKKIDTGYIGGLGQSLLWSLEYFTTGLFRSRMAGKMVKAFFFWIRWIEKIIPETYNSDGACGTYFLGEKSAMIDEKKIIDYINQYDGAQK